MTDRVLTDRKESDAFGNCHPAVGFCFFVFAVGFGALIIHPAYILLSGVLSASYYILLQGRKALKMLGLFLPLCLFTTLLNPLLNTLGERVLFRVFGRPYTLEALLYGAALSGMLLSMLLWMGCYNAAMSSDKFTALFGRLIPTVSMLLLMVLRLVPNLIRKGAQLAGARKCIGHGMGENSTRREQLTDGVSILSALMSWALEGGVTTADSMKSRGYGTARRTAFHTYSLSRRDTAMLCCMSVLSGLILWDVFSGGTAANFTPVMDITPLRGWYWLGYCAYGAFLSLPTALYIKEAIQWHISRSKI